MTQSADMPTVIRFDNVTTSFIVKDEKPDSVMGTFLQPKTWANLFKSGKKKIFQALKEVSFEIKQGEVVGFIGPNGAGKSTLLRLMAGILQPDSGTVEVHGKVAALLELGAGFHPELTGRENIYLNGSILGIKRKRIGELADRIIDFAELREFIDRPLKTYSSGMQERLGFSIAASIDPDILIVDEVLAVGDESFQRKCLQTIRDFNERKKTIIMVTHDLHTAKTICDRVFMMLEGRIINRGDPTDVVNCYLLDAQKKSGESSAELESQIEIGKAELSVKGGSVETIFMNGRLKLLHNGKQVSKGPELYASIYSNSIWHDSNQAIWTHKKLDNGTLLAEGKYRRLPLIQRWRISPGRDNCIKLAITYELLEQLEIRELQTSLCVYTDFDRWKIDNDSGVFERLPHGQQEWVQVNKGNVFSKSITAWSDGKKSMPKITFQSYGETASGFTVSLLNSDYGNNARVLQFLKINSSRESIKETGSHPYFEGEIFFE